MIKGLGCLLRDFTPDPNPAGGSSFIAAKVNEAKDILLGKKKPGSMM